ncbi:dTDP-glucose pyrophosphorylase [Desulfitobacterium dichloroeliminans LMG P-21439]|uniref:Glucose-1-phosphate thymidylyltransferase n=1 Tax=Desulfitobacterium dichloroeliminans (strain LMG P-21439 / DCA1) TaxID=871963 RepID=L0F569_DESDL|nr:sugar phosphate nucleotidyltransferase [Desulfitobacterium dichloroeliminans]AGA68979.1 dTDP-glucose pyrophosphorylase [Desulfitobacterium dichloroeliminans LMG P-21439]
MKGVVLAGGTGSRIFPLTKVTNKHLLPVGKCPMIYYPIAKLKEAGITEILIVTGREHMGEVVNLLGSGNDLGLNFTFKVQDQAGGIAQALSLAEDFAGQEAVTVILGDNVFEESLRDYVTEFQGQGQGAKILLQRVDDPGRYGVAELDENNKVLAIEEKPTTPKSNFCVTGIYMFDAEVYSIVKTLKPSKRGELEITDVNNAYIQAGSLSADIISGWWIDAGTFGSLKTAHDLVYAGKLDDQVLKILEA